MSKDAKEALGQPRSCALSETSCSPDRPGRDDSTRRPVLQSRVPCLLRPGVAHVQHSRPSSREGGEGASGSRLRRYAAGALIPPPRTKQQAQQVWSGAAPRAGSSTAVLGVARRPDCSCGRGRHAPPAGEMAQDLAIGCTTAQVRRQDHAAHAGARQGATSAPGGGTRGDPSSGRYTGAPAGHRSAYPVTRGSRSQSASAAPHVRLPGWVAAIVRQRLALARPPRRRPRCNDSWTTSLDRKARSAMGAKLPRHA